MVFPWYYVCCSTCDTALSCVTSTYRPSRLSSRLCAVQLNTEIKTSFINAGTASSAFHNPSPPVTRITVFYLLVWSIRLCILVLRVPGYRSRGPGFDSLHYQILWEVVGLERGPLSLVSAIEELLERKRSGAGLENREHGHRDPSRWPRGTLYPQKLALTSPTSGCRSVGIVRLRTQATKFSFLWNQVSNAFRERYCWLSSTLFNRNNNEYIK
jgi:hypothetical protein